MARLKSREVSGTLPFGPAVALCLGMTTTTNKSYSPAMACAALDTLLDPRTVVDPSRKDIVRNVVARCQDASLDCAPGSDMEAAILQRCAAAIARWSLYE